MRATLRFLLWAALIVGGLIGLLRLTAIRWWTVPADDEWLAASTSPTLRPGDIVILWRLTAPARTDLVVCPEPGAPERLVVGRVLAAGPEDKISVSGTTVTLNGRMVGSERGCDRFTTRDPRSGEEVEFTCTMEDYHRTLYMRGNANPKLQPPPPMAKPVELEDGEFFLVSDNRQFPLDSRDFGPVEAKTCKETFVFRLWGTEGFFASTRRFEIIH